MTVGGYDLMGVFINWFPMLLLIGVWIFFLRRMRGSQINMCQSDYVAIAQRQADLLERIAIALEKHST